MTNINGGRRSRMILGDIHSLSGQRMRARPAGSSHGATQRRCANTMQNDAACSAGGGAGGRESRVGNRLVGWVYSPTVSRPGASNMVGEYTHPTKSAVLMLHDSSGVRTGLDLLLACLGLFPGQARFVEDSRATRERNGG